MASIGSSTFAGANENKISRADGSECDKNAEHEISQNVDNTAGGVGCIALLDDKLEQTIKAFLIFFVFWLLNQSAHLLYG
jgi:hypothetical protein